MKQRDDGLRGIFADEPNALHGLECAGRLARFSACTAETRAAIGRGARRCLRDVQKRTGERATKLVNPRPTAPRQRLDELLTERERVERHAVSGEVVMIEAVNGTSSDGGERFVVHDFS